MRKILATLAFFANMSLSETSRADECTDHKWIPQTERCLWFGVKTRLNIMQSGVEKGLEYALTPAFYKMVVVRTGRIGLVSDSFVSVRHPSGTSRDWFANFYVYVTPEYLAERDSYPSLIRAGVQRSCESKYLHRTEPDTPEKWLERRETIERCVFRVMQNHNEQHYYTALAREIELGDAFLAQFKGMRYVELRDTIRARFGFAREMFSFK